MHGRVPANFLSVAAALVLSAAGAPSLAAQAQTSATTQEFARITAATPLQNGIDLRDGDLRLQITALRADVLRLRASRTGVLPEDASWAVLAAARSSSVPVSPSSDDLQAGFRTAKLQVSVDRSTGLLRVLDSSGHVLQQQAEPLRFRGSEFTFAQNMAPDEHYFGLGDKTGAFDHRDEAFRMWNTDAYEWQESTDPLYKSIPFLLTYRAGVSLGVLFDNTFPTSFDFGKTLTNTFQYRAEGGPVDLYLLYGPDARQVLGGYAWLTGPTPLPPLWTLGFQQSRYSYMSQAEVLSIAARLRADHIPSDAIYLDIDYQQNNRPFTVNTATFPDMKAMVASLHGQGFHVVAITDLHIADLPGQQYAPYDSGVAGNHFVHNPDGSIFIGPVWPGPSVFPDFTRQQTRAWWGGLYRQLDDDGIDGFWNDMNEPSVFTELKTMPDDVVHRIDEPGFAARTATHREIHNVYGMENSRATFDGQLVRRPDVRPFVLTRASYAGGQRYAATWTGDNSPTWNHLRLTTSMIKNLGLSGFSLAGADVGGYAGTPTAELLTKWIEIAAFQPIDRDHAEKRSGPHEPWANGPEQEDIRRRFIETRYRLLPYLYTTMADDTSSGLPLERPLFLEFPHAARDGHPIDTDLDTGGEFMVGPDILVAAPPFPDKASAYTAEIPSEGWFDFWTGARLRVTTATVASTSDFVPSLVLQPALETLPVFVRPGAMIPVQPLVQSTSERPQGPLLLRVFPGPDCHGDLYQDDGSSFAYKRGSFLRMRFSCQVTDNGLTVHIGRHEGSFAPWWTSIDVEVNGRESAPADVTVNGKAAKFTMNSNRLTVHLADDGDGADIVLR
jgi:alpha-glucosidase